MEERTPIASSLIKNREYLLDPTLPVPQADAASSAALR